MRKRTRRKVWALVNPIEHAMKGASVVLDRAQLSRQNWLLLDELRAGTMTLRPAFDRLTRAILVGDRMRQFSLGREHLRTFEAAMAALNAIRDRKNDSGRDHYLASGPELQALRDALLVHDVQLEYAAVSELQEAWRKLEASEMTVQGAMRRRQQAA